MPVVTPGGGRPALQWKDVADWARDNAVPDEALCYDKERHQPVTSVTVTGRNVYLNQEGGEPLTWLHVKVCFSGCAEHVVWLRDLEGSRAVRDLDQSTAGDNTDFRGGSPLMIFQRRWG
jgi:hypothetical protein